MKTIKLALDPENMKSLYCMLSDMRELNEGYLNDEEDVAEINNLTDTNKMIDDVLKQMEVQRACD